MMANLRAGLLGLGMMGRNHARVLASLDGVDLVGIADPTGGVAGAAPIGVPVVDSVEQLLAIGIDYAMVSTPTQYHLETALILAEAGIHALIEKPLTTDVESARRIVILFQGASLMVQWATSSDTTQPCSRLGRASRGVIWARSVSDHHTPPGSVPRTNRRCRGDLGPGHPRH